jgi:hypothetical protein
MPSEFTDAQKQRVWDDYSTVRMAPFWYCPNCRCNISLSIDPQSHYYDDIVSKVVDVQVKNWLPNGGGFRGSKPADRPEGRAYHTSKGRKMTDCIYTFGPYSERMRIRSKDGEFGLSLPAGGTYQHIGAPGMEFYGLQG